jgi:hypothetical protein
MDEIVILKIQHILQDFKTSTRIQICHSKAANLCKSGKRGLDWVSTPFQNSIISVGVSKFGPNL